MSRTRRTMSVGMMCGAVLAAVIAAPAQASGGHPRAGAPYGESPPYGGAPYGSAPYGKPPHWELKDSGTEVRFRGLAGVSRSTAWVAGSRDAVLRTADGRRTWSTVDTGSYDTVDCTAGFGCWTSGEKGRIARLERS